MDLRRDGSGIARLASQCKSMHSFLVLPLSNAASERAFSMVRRIGRDFRSELAQDTVCVFVICDNEYRCAPFRLRARLEDCDGNEEGCLLL